MKNLYALIGLLFILLGCGDSDEENMTTCQVGNAKIDCDTADIYNQFLAMEEEINNTFEGKTTPFSFKERHQMRTDITDFYSQNKAVLDKAYESVVKSNSTFMSPGEINEMRQGEAIIFADNLKRKEDTDAFLADLDIDTYEKDTLLYDYAGEEKYVLLRVKNTSDKTISSFIIAENKEIDGQMVYDNNATPHLFIENQIVSDTPQGSNLAVLEPGKTLILAFEIKPNEVPKPEIVGIDFIKPEE